MQASKSLLLRPLALLLIVCFASGCVVGQRIKYDDASVVVGHQGQGAVAVVTQDRRPYVVNGQKTPDYVGVQRSGLGIPYWVRTESHQPLADDLTSLLKRALARHGYRVTTIAVKPGTTSKALVEKIKAAGTQRSIVLYIDQWESDTFANIRLEYDLTLFVIDSTGHVLAKATDGGEENLEGSFGDPVGVAQRTLPQTLAERLTALVNAPQVVNAIQQSAAPTAPPGLTSPQTSAVE